MYSIRDINSGMYLIEEEGGKFAFGAEDDRILFFDLNDAENTLDFLNNETEHCCILLDECK